MSFAEFRRLVELLPDGGALTLSKAALLALVGAEGAEAATPSATPLTARELAQRLNRAPSTIRGWCAAGHFPGAFRLNGRDWRVPMEAVESFLAGQQARYGSAPEVSATRAEPVDLGAWRQALRPAA